MGGKGERRGGGEEERGVERSGEERSGYGSGDGSGEKTQVGGLRSMSGQRTAITIPLSRARSLFSRPILIPRSLLPPPHTHTLLTHLV